ncbi:PHB depolymerase family esterase [Trinickia sp. EG282A]|uniref:extracellular catalytic domain type 1 short-chain-length polyhydroxyalkanoate depolymerase n=1 Tax=Trinickia sp. EG282A TaxID=3237013 RepID=UPI0034D36B30
MKMNEDFLASLQEATRLLHTAGPMAATAAIQRALGGTMQIVKQAQARGDRDAVIDVLASAPLSQPDATVSRHALVLGVQHFSLRDLEAAQATGERLHIEVLGLATIAIDVPAELALATIESVTVLGAFQASPAVKAALGGRIHGGAMPIVKQQAPASEGYAGVIDALAGVAPVIQPDAFPIFESKRNPEPGTAAPSDEVEDRGHFLTRLFSCPAGAREYKLYVPSAYDGQRLPLVVMLHGCTQNADDFAAGTRMNALAESQPCFVVYPTQSQSANVSKCWNWFKPGDQRRGQGEPSIIAGITQEVIDTYQVDTRRVYVAGLSAGGAMAAVMADTYPELYAAVGVHSGPALGAAHNLPSALAVMNGGSAGRSKRRARPAHAAPTPTIVFHGDADSKVHPCNGDHLIAAFSGGDTMPNSTMHQGQVPGGRSYTRRLFNERDGIATCEQWIVHGAPHAWSGGSSAGSYTDVKGPDASKEMLRFFLAHAKTD